MFFLFILIILLFLVLAIQTSRLGIEIENLKIDTQKPKGEKINKDSKIIVYLSIFKKIKILKKDIKNIDYKKLKFRKDIDFKILNNKDFKINYKDLLEKKHVKIEQIDLCIRIGTEDAAITALATGILATIIGTILRKPRYRIIPIYSNRNFLKMELDCIFSVHLMQYMYKVISNKIKDLGKQGSTKENESEFLNKKVEV